MYIIIKLQEIFFIPFYIYILNKIPYNQKIIFCVVVVFVRGVFIQRASIIESLRGEEIIKKNFDYCFIICLRNKQYKLYSIYLI